MKIRIFLSISFLALAGCLLVIPNIINARAFSDPYTFDVNSSPYGIPFKDWTAKWSSWYFSIPKEKQWNNRDSTGYVPEDCSYLQDQTNPVFYMPFVGAELGSKATMTCNVPQNKAILVPIDGATSDYSDPTVKTKTPNELIRLLTQSNIYPVSFDLTLDGHPLSITNEEKYKVTSNLFDLVLPANNIWGERPGPDKAITQNWWVMLKPLPPGDHILHYFTGYRDSKSDPTIPPGQGNQSPYAQEVTYHIVVK